MIETFAGRYNLGDLAFLLFLAVWVTYSSIKRAKTPAERSFAWKLAVSAVAVFLPLYFVSHWLEQSGVIPEWLLLVLWAMLLILMLPVFRWAKNRRAALRDAGISTASGEKGRNHHSTDG